MSRPPRYGRNGSRGINRRESNVPHAVLIISSHTRFDCSLTYAMKRTSLRGISLCAINIHTRARELHATYSTDAVTLQERRNNASCIVILQRHYRNMQLRHFAQMFKTTLQEYYKNNWNYPGSTHTIFIKYV